MKYYILGFMTWMLIIMAYVLIRYCLDTRKYGNFKRSYFKGVK